MTARAATFGAWVVATASAALAACDTVPDLPSSSLVDRPRILAVLAEPPEVNPGEDATLSVLLGGFDSAPALRWRACSAFASTERNRQYQEMSLEQGCSGSLSLDLGEGPTAVLPGEATALLFNSLELAGDVLGIDLPEETVRQLREDVGLPLSIEVDTEYAGKTLRAMKRVLVSEHASPHTNPPPPQYALDDTEIVTEPGEPLRCVTANGEPAHVARDVEVELAPAVDGDDEPWIETYNVLDVYGQLQEREEVASYTWFTSAGKLDEDVTRAPLRNQLWQTPDADVCAQLWVVVRDGHGGTSGCALTVTVGDADDCEP